MCAEDINNLQERLRQLEEDLYQGAIDQLEYEKMKIIFIKIEGLKNKIEEIAKRGLN